MKTEADHEGPLPRNNGAKTKRIDLGLAMLSAVAPPRATLSAEDIACWCGCTPAFITSIEARALRRLKAKVRAHFKLSHFSMADRRRFLALHFQP